MDIENILTISAKEWFEISGEKPKGYEAKGVHVKSSSTRLFEEFIKKVPPRAEVVVEYRIYLAQNTVHPSYAYGTALIPKSRR